MNNKYIKGNICANCIKILGRTLRDYKGTTWSYGDCEYCKASEVPTVDIRDTE